MRTDFFLFINNEWRQNATFCGDPSGLDPEGSPQNIKSSRYGPKQILKVTLAAIVIENVFFSINFTPQNEY